MRAIEILPIRGRQYDVHQLGLSHQGVRGDQRGNHQDDDAQNSERLAVSLGRTRPSAAPVPALNYICHAPSLCSRRRRHPRIAYLFLKGQLLE